jgi:hypothetical protein
VEYRRVKSKFLHMSSWPISNDCRGCLRNWVRRASRLSGYRSIISCCRCCRFALLNETTSFLVNIYDLFGCGSVEGANLLTKGRRNGFGIILQIRESTSVRRRGVKGSHRLLFWICPSVHPHSSLVLLQPEQWIAPFQILSDPARGHETQERYQVNGSS